MPLRDRRDQRGLVLPTAAVVASIVTVAVAAVGFVLTSHPGAEADPAHATPVVAPPPTLTPTPTPQRPQRKRAAVDRKGTFVEVFNNSNVRGLAGRTSERAQRAGWNVVGSDNWYGTVDTSTVYYPQRLQRAAKALAKDLGIDRTKPAIAPMKLDRLTVILTSGYTG